MKFHHYNLVVVGATPGGIACAVRAAREGLDVLLTHYRNHVGGVLCSGLSGLDTQYTGRRCNLLSEFCDGVLEHYRSEFGERSEQFQTCLRRAPTQFWIDHGKTTARDDERPVEDISHGYYGRLHFEPQVGERVLLRLLQREKRVTLLTRCFPKSVVRNGRSVEAIVLQFRDGSDDLQVAAEVFVDATMEADLAALAGLPYRVGREARSEHGERHAGKIFMGLEFAKVGQGGFPQDAVKGKLNLIPYDGCTTEIFTGSTGEGDAQVQAYNYRICLSCDPENRIIPQKPPTYDREVFMELRSRWGLGTPLPNNKMKWNAANLPGGAINYPEGDWRIRREIEQRHRDHALGFLFFLQNDQAVPEDFRKEARRWGLAKDEFTDNGNFPYEMYVREARRIVGRYVFTEHDATLAPGSRRTPIHGDSIAIAEHPMDSHSVSFESRAGSRREGKFLLSELTRPSQIPFRTLLPKNIDNLMVPVCISSSHVGWGTLRLEPVFMHVGESAGYAASMAVSNDYAPADLNTDQLQRKLVENGVMISFFNDFDMATPEPWVPAVQYFGTKGFFGSYDARPNEVLTEDTARYWAKIVTSLKVGSKQPIMEPCNDVHQPATLNSGITLREFFAIVEKEFNRLEIETRDFNKIDIFSRSDGSAFCKRGEACLMLYRYFTGK